MWAHKRLKVRLSYLRTLCKCCFTFHCQLSLTVATERESTKNCQIIVPNRA